MSDTLLHLSLFLPQHILQLVRFNQVIFIFHKKKPVQLKRSVEPESHFTASNSEDFLPLVRPITPISEFILSPPSDFQRFSGSLRVIDIIRGNIPQVSTANPIQSDISFLLKLVTSVECIFI